MLGTSESQHRPSQVGSTTMLDLSGADVFDTLTNPFLEVISQPQHDIYDNSSCRTPQPKLSYSIPPELPIFDPEPRLSHNSSFSTQKVVSGSMFSCLYSQESLPPASRLLSDASLPLSSPSAMWSQSTHDTAFTTPGRLRAPATSSPSRSPYKSLEKSSPCFLDSSPFKHFMGPKLPTLFDLQSSPVVRRSLGDVTPVYRSRGNIGTNNGSNRMPRGLFREAVTSDEEAVEILPPPSPSWRKPSTSFLQKLSRGPESLQKQSIPDPSCSPMPSTPTLASPFILKFSVSENEPCVQSSLSTPSPAKNVTMPDFEKYDSANSVLTGTPAERRIPHSLFSSPLSELSASPSNSPRPSALQAMFKDDGRTRRMQTRSTVRLEWPGTPNLPAARKLKLKRKPANTKFEDAPGDDAEPSMSRKRRKIPDEIVVPPLKAARWIMSKGAGPVTFSSKSRPNGCIPASTSNAVSVPFSSQPQINNLQIPSTVIHPHRKFPSLTPINDSFPRLYRKFPVPSFFCPDGTSGSVLIEGNNPAAPSGHARVNIPRGGYDLYTPRFTKGVGINKQGLCPICYEAAERGGADLQEWCSMKFSAYKCYHMQYYHGISPTTGRPFSPPIQFRTQPRPHARKFEKTEVLEGQCHKCRQWIPVEGVKNGTVNVKELFWWKHAAICHKTSRLPGDDEIFVEDVIFCRLKLYDAVVAEENVTNAEDE